MSCLNTDKNHICLSYFLSFLITTSRSPHDRIPAAVDLSFGSEISSDTFGSEASVKLVHRSVVSHASSLVVVQQKMLKRLVSPPGVGKENTFPPL